MSVMTAASALLQAVLWLLAAGLRSVCGGSTRRAPPCVASKLSAGSCPCRIPTARARTYSDGS